MSETPDWYPPRLFRVLLHFTAFTTLIFWLPTVRGLMDGETYQWGLFGFGGAGLAGDYWFPLLGATFAFSIQYLGWRGGRLPVHFLLLAWYLFLAFGAFYLAMADPDSFVIRGETLNIDIDLSWLGPVIFGAALLGSLWLAIRDMTPAGKRSAPAWTRQNTVWAGVLAGLLPVQFVLLGFGEPHGTTDQAGVVITVLQWMLVGSALRPYPPRAT